MIMKRIKTIILLTTLVVFFALPSFSQDKDSNEKKVEKKVNVTMKMDGNKVHLKVIENGEAVLEKTYNSKEEMKSDPELKEYNVFTGDQGSFMNGEGRINVTVKEDGDKKIIFIGENGEKHEISGGGHNVWIYKDGEGATGEGEVFFKSDDGTNSIIIKDKDGNITIEKDGEVVDLSEHLKVEKRDDGTLVITDETGTREIKMGDMDHGAVFFSKDGEFETKDGNVMHMKTKEDGNGNVTIELDGSNVWYSDSLHENEHTVLFFSESDEQLHEEGGKRIIVTKEITSGEGDGETRVIVKVERIHLEIVDLDDLKEIEEIPGSNVVSSKMLQLEEVSYYPNPNTGVFNLKFSAKKKPTSIRVIDMMGKEVYFEQLDNFTGRYDQQIDLTGNDRGVYILQIIQGARTWNKKVLIE